MIFFKFVVDKTEKLNFKKQPNLDSTKTPLTFRLQDKELQEMKDDGMCLTMHQPYASLLVQGIKK
jgi:hypothetical protein